jgi:hypothetical protein
MADNCNIGNCPKRVVTTKNTFAPKRTSSALSYNCEDDSEFSAGLKGAFHGVAGMFGFGDFWKVMDDSELKQIQDNFDKQADGWSDCISKCEYSVLESQQELAKAIESNKELIYKNRDEIVDERLKVNSLMILFSLSFIILIYVYILTQPNKIK